MTTLWLVGQEKAIDWEFQGIFDDQNLAINACRDENYFYVPTILNLEWPHETVGGGAVYPKRDAQI